MCGSASWPVEVGGFHLGTTGTTPALRTIDQPTDRTAHLDLTAPFEVGPALAVLAATALPGAELVDVESACLTRFLARPDDTPTLVTVRLHRDHVELTHAASSGSELEHLTATVRSWLDLDADPDAVATALGADPQIGAMVTSRPGLRVIGYPDGFEAAVMTITGQQVSVAAARGFGARAVAAFGGVPQSATGLRPFPTAADLSAVHPTEIQAAIGVTHSRARSIRALATACTEGLVISPGPDGPGLRRELLALPGIGPWTVDLLAVRALGDRDGYPSGDLVLQRALGVGSAIEARTAAEAWSPFRAYALFHLWSSALGI
jgi:3-methyladenine DNA glycosylase/8-oxoguanine DNA glycosylase